MTNTRKLKTVFLCHHQDGGGPEVHELADELRLRGVIPWVDVQGGFKIGDHMPSGARQAIGEESFGTLIYATPEIFKRDFIREYEIPAAIRAWQADHGYVLSVIDRGLGFGRISRDSVPLFGSDLTAFCGEKVSDDPAQRQAAFQRIGMDLLVKSLRAIEPNRPAMVSFQFSTRELLDDDDDDLFRVDATRAITDVTDAMAWHRVERGLLDVKTIVSRQFSRTPARVHGSKHLTGAFLLGSVFPSTTGPLSIRTGGGYWSSDVAPTPFSIERQIQTDQSDSNILVLEIDILGHSVSEPVTRYLGQQAIVPRVRISLAAPPDRTYQAITNGQAITITKRIRTEITTAVKLYPELSSVHLFGPVPQGLAMLIGRRTNALPPIQLHEFIGGDYYPSHRLNDVSRLGG